MVCSLTVQRKKPSCITHMAFTSGRCDTSPLIQEKQINCGSLVGRGRYLNRYEVVQAGVHDRAEHAHARDPGPGNGSFRPPLASPWAALATGTAVSILLAPRFPPSPARSVAPSLVCGCFHLHRKRHASASGCADLPCQSRSLSVGSQSDVSGCSGDGDRAGHPLSLVPASLVCSAGMGSGLSVCGFRRGILSASPVWGGL